jgi:hypothetical protein
MGRADSVVGAIERVSQAKRGREFTTEAQRHRANCRDAGPEAGVPGRRRALSIGGAEEERNPRQTLAHPPKYHRHSVLLIVLEDDLTSAGIVEGGGDIGIAWLVSSDGQGVAFDLVDGINVLADVVLRRAFDDDAGELLGVGVFAEGEGPLEPIVGVRAVEFQGVAGNEQ